MATVLYFSLALEIFSSVASASITRAPIIADVSFVTKRAKQHFTTTNMTLHSCLIQADVADN